LAVIAVGAGPAASPAAAAPPVRTNTLPTAHLTAASIAFHTNDDDKDGDTDVLMFIVRGDRSATAASATYGPLDHFDDNTDNGPFAMITDTNTVATQLSTFFVNIIIVPFGHDTWKFNYTATLSFSDGSTYLAHEQNIRLDQDNNVLFTQFTLVTQVAVPRLIGESEGDARADLAAVGLTTGSVTHRPDRNCEFINKVSGQNPGADSIVDPGTAVNLTIGDKPKNPCT
jgi:hypothetical protein